MSKIFVIILCISFFLFLINSQETTISPTKMGICVGTSVFAQTVYLAEGFFIVVDSSIAIIDL